MKITAKEISQFIYEPYLSRGKNYCERGLVNILYISKHRVRALCSGTKIYTVSIKLNNGRLEGKCSCPAWDDFGPCKHMAATCFTLIDLHSQSSKNMKENMQKIQDIRLLLENKAQDELIEYVLAYCDDYDELFEKLWNS